MTSDQTIELRDLVNQLTQPRNVPVYQAGQLIHHRPDPALLQALKNACTTMIGTGGGGHAAHERSALNTAASELYASIQRRTRGWALAADVPRHWQLMGAQPVDWTDPAQLLRAWHTRVIGDAHFDERPYLSTLRGWITTIQDLIIDPPRRWSIATPCPLCDARWVINTSTIGSIPIDANGRFLNRPLNPDGLAASVRNMERTDALSVIERDPSHMSMTVCGNCAAVWHGIGGARQLRIAIDDHASQQVSA
jgi:hypothetical protein